MPEDPTHKSQRKNVGFLSLGALLIESSLEGDKPTPFPSYQALLDNTMLFWLEYQKELLYNHN